MSNLYRCQLPKCHSAGKSIWQLGMCGSRYPCGHKVPVWNGGGVSWVRAGRGWGEAVGHTL